MIIDASRGEIQLDDLFNAIEHDKDQVTQALDIYGDYLKAKNDEEIDGQKKIDILERILKLECMEKTNANHNNHENERARINLKWTVLTECGFWYRKLAYYEKAIKCFEKVRCLCFEFLFQMISRRMGLTIEFPPFITKQACVISN